MDECKDSVWTFFEEHVVPAIRKYQIEEIEESDGFTSEKFEKYLLQAVSKLNPSQVLTFLRKVKEDSFGIFMPQFAKTLQENGIAHTTTNVLLKSMQRVYGDKLIAGKQHIFLLPGSKLTYIPSGRSARKHSETIYARCVVLARSALSEEACLILEQAFIGLDDSAITSITDLELHHSQDSRMDVSATDSEVHISSSTPLNLPDSEHESAPEVLSLSTLSSQQDRMMEQISAHSLPSEEVRNDADEETNSLPAINIEYEVMDASTLTDSTTSALDNELLSQSSQHLPEKEPLFTQSSPRVTTAIDTAVPVENSTADEVLNTDSRMDATDTLSPQPDNSTLQCHQEKEKASHSGQKKQQTVSSPKRIIRRSKRKCVSMRNTPWPSPTHRLIVRSHKSPRSLCRSPLKALLTVVSVDKTLDNGNSEVCRGCGKKYVEKEWRIWIGCDNNNSHWWHYKCAGFKRMPSKRTKFTCILCKSHSASACRQLNL